MSMAKHTLTSDNRETGKESMDCIYAHAHARTHTHMYCKTQISLNNNTKAKIIEDRRSQWEDNV